MGREAGEEAGEGEAQGERGGPQRRAEGLLSRGTPGEARIARCWRAQGLSTEGPRRGSWASVPCTDLSPCLSLGSFASWGHPAKGKDPLRSLSTRTAGRCWAGLPRGAAPSAPGCRTPGRRPQGREAAGQGEGLWPTCWRKSFPPGAPSRGQPDLLLQTGRTHRTQAWPAAGRGRASDAPQGGGRDSATLQLEAGGSYTPRDGSYLWRATLSPGSARRQACILPADNTHVQRKPQVRGGPRDPETHQR